MRAVEVCSLFSLVSPAQAGDWSGARRIGLGSIYLSLAFTTLCAMMSTTISSGAALLFTSDPNVVRQYAVIAPIIAVVLIVDNCVVVMQGVMAACGFQHKGAVCNFLGCWLVGMPLGWYLAFGQELGLAGLWIGILLGMCTALLSLTIIFKRTNFEDLARELCTTTREY